MHLFLQSPKEAPMSTLSSFCLVPDFSPQLSSDEHIILEAEFVDLAVDLVDDLVDDYINQISF